jgi:hypothetical protein
MAQLMAIAATASSTMNTLPPPSQEASPICACDVDLSELTARKA